MRIGIYGGAFDPVHYGHLLLAEMCREQCQLDEVWFVPTRRPPHKDLDLTEGRHRVEMLKFAVAGHRQFQVKTLELDREETSWTVDTLAVVKSQQPESTLFFLMGADSLRDLPTWRQPERIAQLATLVAVNRGTQKSEEFLKGLAPSIVPRVRFVTMPGVALSATEIRERIRHRQSVRFMVPRAVEEYIAQHGLYRDEPSR